MHNCIIIFFFIKKNLLKKKLDLEKRVFLKYEKKK